MIFVTVGSQKFQFDRLIEKIDELVKNGTIKEKVIAQIGYSYCNPENIEFYDFLTQEQFEKYMQQADLIITHGGTGVIVNASKLGKKIIAIPRMAKYGEHVDDHQIQLIDQFKDANMIEPVYDISEIQKALENVKNKKYDKYVSNTNLILEDIIKFIGD